MISLYSGTPGSGKSLDVCRLIYYRLRFGKDVICNFPISTDRIKCRKMGVFTYIDNADLDPAKLVKYAMQKPRKEGEILLVIDEAQILFNAREWGKAGRSDWMKFFTQHRKLGYEIFLIAQFDSMLDKQIRALIEYEYKHRKVTNMGWRGWFIRPFVGGFCKVQIWYPMKEVIGLEFFRYSRKFANLYDTNALFNVDLTQIGSDAEPQAN